jgi:UDP-glucose:(glucosyl)LPS alpha-1,2-glucosyltransferase
VPSVWPDPFGRVAPEAMACGAAVISSTWGALPEVCANGALLRDPMDIDALTDALASMADTPTRAELCRAGEKRARELSWDNSYHALVHHLAP